MDLTQRYYTETLLPIRENNEETDPIFTASPAYGISSEDIANWNNKQLKLSAVQVIGSMYRTNVSGGGGISIQDTTGLFPTILEAGTYTVITDMLSNTLSYGITVNFGGNTYTLNTTDGHIYDSRLLTIPANGRWSGTVVGSVAANTRLSVKVENIVDEVTSISLVGITNDYNDLNNKPTLTNYFANAAYDSNTKRINFKNSNNVIIAYIDATAFIKDGMVDSVEISNGKLIITFNTESGKEPIEIDLTDIFNPSNYYDKDTVDTLLGAKVNTTDLATVATSGNYNDLSNTPTIPAALIQADWNQTTTTALDYIKNKPNIVQTRSGGTEIRNEYGNILLGRFGNIYLNGLYVTLSDGKNSVTLDQGGDSGINIIANDGSDGTISLTASSDIRVAPGASSKFYYNNKEVATKNDIPAAQIQSDWNQTTTTALDYIKNKPTIPTVPTNVSAFTNDVGYLTSHQDISGKENKVSVETISGTSLSASTGTYYVGSSIGTLTVTLPTVSDTTHIASVVLNITTGSSPAVTFTAASGVTISYSKDFVLEANTEYEVNCLWQGNKWLIIAVEFEY